MVSSVLTYPDLEAGLIEWASQLPALKSENPSTRYLHVGDELPSRYVDRLPFLEISVGTGATDGVTWVPSVLFHMFAPSRSVAQQVLTDLFAKIEVYPRRFGGISVDAVQITVYPHRSKSQEPDDSTCCFSGEITASLRRQKGN